MASASPAQPAVALSDLSPGSKRPGEQALQAVRESRKRPNSNMLPPAPRPASSLLQASSAPKVVDDDEFETKLAAIIERDYFPDIKRLQNKLEWTQAAESGDVDRIANAQRNIVLRRAGFSVPLNAQVPTSSDPSPTPDRSQSGPHTSSSNATPASPAAEKPAELPQGTILPPPQDVAAFTSRHTTEDQASMDSIVAADNARHRIRHQWAYEESDRTNNHLLAAGHQSGLLLTAPPSTSAGAGPSSTAAAITEGGSTSTAGGATDGALGTAPSASGDPAQSSQHPSALVITLPDDGGTPRRRMRRAHPMPVLRTSHAAPPSRAVVAAAKAMRAKALAQSQAQAHLQAAGLHSAKSALYYPPARNLPLSLNERRLMAAGAPPRTIAAHTRFPSSSQASGDGRGGSETPSTLASTPSQVYSPADSPASGSDAGDAQDAATRDAHVPQIGGGPGMGGVATPSPAHLGAAAAPIMTWGEVAGTPMVLEGDLFQGDDAARVGGASRGVLQGPRSVKERAADHARKELAQARVRDNRGRHAGVSRGHSSLSPAAASFVKKLQGKSPWGQADAQLRASYGHRTPGTSSRSALAHTAATAAAARTPLATASGPLPSPRGLLGDMTPERPA